MSKEMIIAVSSHETKVALREEGQVVEVFVEREKEVGLVGSIYKGRVTRVLPGMQSAFVDVGLERDAFLYVSDFEELEDYERVAEDQEAEEPQPESPAPTPPSAEEPALAGKREPPTQSRAGFERSEPPLALPERRPLGRGRRRGRRPRRRGGRRPPHERGPRREPAPVEPHEPVILPGESLAKYRNRASPPPETEERPQAPEDDSSRNSAPEQNPHPEGNSHPNNRVSTPNEGANPKTESPSQGPTLSSEENEEKSPSNESFSNQAGAGSEDTSREPESAPDSERGKEGTGSESTNEHYPEATTLVEIERVRRYEGEVGLPPSVEERTAGGVEWQRMRSKHRRGRHRRHRGRRRHRQQEARERPHRPSFHARPTRGQPAIAELLRPGQEIIVQIAKEQMGKKGARITSHVTLPGRLLVYMPTIDHIGISRKIGTSEERSRLRRLLLELKGRISGGFVVRTAAANCSEEDLHLDIDYLVKLWHDIRMRFEEASSPALLHRDLNLQQRVLRDHLAADYESVWIDSEEEYARVVEFVGRLNPALAARVKLYTKPAPIFEEMGVQQEIDRALRPKMWLKSGGYIVINHTEALVAIDVNTGKFVGKGSTRLEDTIVKTNLEAVKEIVRQIRLRDLGGIIVIDFIDMEDRRNRHRVMHALEEALRSDRSPSKLLAFNEFGLVAITRKRSRQPLERLLCQPCPYCTGTGMVKSIPTLCYEIQHEAKKMAETIDAPELTIRAHPEIVKTFKGHDASLVRELEEQTRKNIILQPDNTLHFEQYSIY